MTYLWSIIRPPFRHFREKLVCDDFFRLTFRFMYLHNFLPTIFRFRFLEVRQQRVINRKPVLAHTVSIMKFLVNRASYALARFFVFIEHEPIEVEFFHFVDGEGFGTRRFRCVGG